MRVRVRVRLHAGRERAGIGAHGQRSPCARMQAPRRSGCRAARDCRLPGNTRDDPRKERGPVAGRGCAWTTRSLVPD